MTKKTKRPLSRLRLLHLLSHFRDLGLLEDMERRFEGNGEDSGRPRYFAAECTFAFRSEAYISGADSQNLAGYDG